MLVLITVDDSHRMRLPQFRSLRDRYPANSQHLTSTWVSLRLRAQLVVCLQLKVLNSIRSRQLCVLPCCVLPWCVHGTERDVTGYTARTRRMFEWSPRSCQTTHVHQSPHTADTVAFDLGRIDASDPIHEDSHRLHAEYLTNVRRTHFVSVGLQLSTCHFRLTGRAVTKLRVGFKHNHRSITGAICEVERIRWRSSCSSVVMLCLRRVTPIARIRLFEMDSSSPLVLMLLRLGQQWHGHPEQHPHLLSCLSCQVVNPPHDRLTTVTIAEGR